MSDPLIVPGFHFKVSKNLHNQTVEINSYFQCVIPKPTNLLKCWSNIPSIGDSVSVEMHYLDDQLLVSMSFQWLKMTYSHGGDWFKKVCDNIEKQYIKLYENKPDYIQKRIMQEVRSWLNTGFKEFIDHNFHPINYGQSLEQKLQDYVVKEIISDKYLYGPLVSNYTAHQVSGQLQNLSRQLPGVDEYVKPICCCIQVCNWMNNEGRIRLWTYIQHLNDAKTHVYYVNKEAGECEVREAYTREEIADWLETLDIDIRFKTPERIRDEQD